MAEYSNIKKDLVELINQVNDPDTLQLVYQVLSAHNNNRGNLEVLNEEQTLELNYAIKESYENKNLVDWDDAKSALGRWLKQ